MNRRVAREIAFKLTYEMVMTGEYNSETRAELMAGADADSLGFVDSVINGIAERRDVLKALIVKYAKGYEFDRIYKADLAVLFVACYELKYTDTPAAVVVNEAIEIAKTYSDVKSHSFINGILASVIREGKADE